MIATWKLPTSKVYHGLNNALGICVHKKHYQVLPTQMVPISALAHGLRGALLFFVHPSNFKIIRAKKIDDLNPIWVRLQGRSQLSNSSGLPCFCLYFVVVVVSVSHMLSWHVIVFVYSPGMGDYWWNTCARLSGMVTWHPYLGLPARWGFF